MIPGRPVAAVCHGPAARWLTKATPIGVGRSLARPAVCAGFTNGEEAAVHLTKVVPFLVEASSNGSAPNTKRQRTGPTSRLLTVNW